MIFRPNPAALPFCVGLLKVCSAAIFLKMCRYDFGRVTRSVVFWFLLISCDLLSEYWILRICSMEADRLEIRSILEWGREKTEGILECIGVGQFQKREGVVLPMRRKKRGQPPDWPSDPDSR